MGRPGSAGRCPARRRTRAAGTPISRRARSRCRRCRPRRGAASGGDVLPVHVLRARDGHLVPQPAVHAEGEQPCAVARVVVGPEQPGPGARGHQARQLGGLRGVHPAGDPGGSFPHRGRRGLRRGRGRGLLLTRRPPAGSPPGPRQLPPERANQAPGLLGRSSTSCRTSATPARSSSSATSVQGSDSCSVTREAEASFSANTASSMNPAAPVEGRPADSGEKPRGQAVAPGEPGVHPLDAPVGALGGPEQLLFEAVGGLLVELLVGLAERPERAAELRGRLAQGVEQLLLPLCGACRPCPQTRQARAPPASA